MLYQNITAGCTYCAIRLRTSIQDALKIADYRPDVKVNCRLQNVVYAISCSRCDFVVCVGETETQVQNRMREYCET